MRGDRWNCGTMRRYHFANGSKLVVTTGRKRPPHVIPAWCAHISSPIDRAAAAAALRQIREAR